jgi:pimeloyl-ACP methyl ester carboxylesterase
LTERGAQALAVDLPGHGEDAGPLADLHGDARRVREALDDIHDPVVLVGHSYGGVVITEAGVHPSVANLVYIASFPLDHNESTSSAAVHEANAAGLDHSNRPDAMAYIHVAEDGTSTVDPEGARLLFYNDCPDDVSSWAVRRLGPHNMQALSQVPREIAWRKRPSIYALCTQDNIVHPELQRILAHRTDDVVEWTTGHSPFLSQPDLVADLLFAAASRLMT